MNKKVRFELLTWRLRFAEMGYDVSITRRSNKSQSLSSEISMEVWQSYVESDSDMEITGYAKATAPTGHSLKVNSPGMTKWTGHSQSAWVWFNYFRGRITVKNPDEEVIQKMKQIAVQLGAEVEGEGGEIY